MTVLPARYRRVFTSRALWRKISRHARGAGLDLIYSALVLYYAAKAPGTPGWARRTIYGALGYFIFPADAVPDWLPAGYADDTAVIVAALAAVALHITSDVKDKARSKLRDWFGDTADRASLLR